MPTLVKTTSGVVTGLWGTALIRQADGKLKVVKIGERVHDGDQILTAQNGIVQITDDDGRTQVAQAAKAPAPDASGDIDKVIEAINSNDPQAATAAGAGAGGGGGSETEGLRVARISEGVSPEAASLGSSGAVNNNAPTLQNGIAAPQLGTSAPAPSPAPAPAPAPSPSSPAPAAVISVSTPHLTND